METELFNMYVNIKKGNMGVGDGSGKLDRLAAVEELK